MMNFSVSSEFYEMITYRKELTDYMINDGRHGFIPCILCYKRAFSSWYDSTLTYYKSDKSDKSDKYLAFLLNLLELKLGLSINRKKFIMTFPLIDKVGVCKNCLTDNNLNVVNCDNCNFIEAKISRDHNKYCFNCYNKVSLLPLPEDILRNILKYGVNIKYKNCLECGDLIRNDEYNKNSGYCTKCFLLVFEV